MNARWFAGIAGSVAVALIAGCTRVPSEAMNEARTALEAARKAGAETYAPSQFKAAKVSYGLAEKEISAESRKIPFMRKYDKVVETLKSATSAAKSAEAAVAATRTRITGETNDLLDRTRTLLDSVDATLNLAEKKKKDPGTIPADLDSARITAMGASAALGTGELLLAKERAMAAHEKAQAVKSAADELMPPVKVKSKKKKK